MTIFAAPNRQVMKVNEMIRKLRKGGCSYLKPGGNHDWWYSPITEQHFQVPRHGAQEVGINLAKAITKQSGVKI